MACKSLLRNSTIDISPGITLRIPEVCEVLDNAEAYYSLVSVLTAVPFQYMAQLDEQGIDFTTISEYELFCKIIIDYSDQELYAKNTIKSLNAQYAQAPVDSGLQEEYMNAINQCQNIIDSVAIDLVFKDFKFTGLLNNKLIGFQMVNNKNQKVLYNAATGVEIDEYTYKLLVDKLREINSIEKPKFKPGNEHAKKYLLEKEKKRLARIRKRKNKASNHQLENMVVALVNTSEFPFDYDSCMFLSIYRFNRSLNQILHKVAFDNTMIGVYSGTVDTKKLKDKSVLSFIQMDDKKS